MSTENNLLLQSAHLRSTKSYKSTTNPYDIDAELAINNEEIWKLNVPEQDGFFKRSCSTTVIVASIATIIIMIIIFILLISYH